jgi:uncharacterized membrane protein
MADATFERAMKLAVVTGMRSMLGPALVARSLNRPEAKNLAVAAMGEMIADKLPLIPSRDTILPLIVRGLAGAWVAKTLQDEEGTDNPWTVPLGAAVAMGVAVAAPKIRKTLTVTTGVSDAVLGMIEDYLALRLGSEAVGLSMDELTQVARDSVEDLRERIKPMVQSVGAGSM